MYSLILALSMTTTPDAIGGTRAAGCTSTQATATSCYGTVHTRERFRFRERTKSGCAGYQATATFSSCNSSQASATTVAGRGRFRQKSVTHNKGLVIYHTQPPPLAAPVPKQQVTPQPQVVPSNNSASTPDALSEVNTARRFRGLRPYILDAALTRAAERCAAFRAARRIPGHTANDFQFLEPGAFAVAGGADAGGVRPFEPFRACCMYDSYTYAGAARVRGSDGFDYCVIFVR